MIKIRLLNDLKKHLSKREISLIIGPRQAGKTTLMLLLRNYLDQQRENTLFLSFDIEADQQYLTSQHNLIQKVHLEFGRKRGYVFIDEIQRKENAGLFLKGLYDLNLPYKFIVSGSGSLELKEKIHESLVGRKRVFELNTLSFEEFVNFRTGYHYEDRLSEFFQVERMRVRELLIEYLNFGGYPALVLEPELREKRLIMDEIYRSVIEKDLSYLLRIEKIDAFVSLMKILSSQIGSMINYSELSSTLGSLSRLLKIISGMRRRPFSFKESPPFL
jgi:hypothetical protein